MITTFIASLGKNYWLMKKFNKILKDPLFKSFEQISQSYSLRSYYNK